MYVASLYTPCLWCSVCFCTGHFVMVPINLTCPHCLQHFFFELLFHLLYLEINAKTIHISHFVRSISTFYWPVSAYYQTLSIKPSIGTSYLGWLGLEIRGNSNQGQTALWQNCGTMHCENEGLPIHGLWVLPRRGHKIFQVIRSWNNFCCHLLYTMTQVGHLSVTGKVMCACYGQLSHQELIMILTENKTQTHTAYMIY